MFGFGFGFPRSRWRRRPRPHVPRSTLSITSADGETTADSTPLVSGVLHLVSGSSVGVTITIRRNGVLLGTAVTGAGGAWSYQVVTTLNDGDFLKAYGPGDAPVSPTSVTYDAPATVNPPIASSTAYRASSSTLLASAA